MASACPYLWVNPCHYCPLECGEAMRLGVQEVVEPCQSPTGAPSLPEVTLLLILRRQNQGCMAGCVARGARLGLGGKLTDPVGTLVQFLLGKDVGAGPQVRSHVATVPCGEWRLKLLPVGRPVGLQGLLLDVALTCGSPIHPTAVPRELPFQVS